MGVILALPALLNQTHFEGDEHVVILKYHPGLFWKTTANIICMRSDICAVNKALDFKPNCYFVLSANHRFDLELDECWSKL